MTPELQAPSATRLPGDTDPLSEHLTGDVEGMQVLEADGGLATHTLDRPPRGRAFDGEGGAVQSAPRASLKLSGAQIDQLGSLFKLLSDKTRLAILQILCDGEMNVSTMCRELKLPQPTVSHHLGLLRMSRLIANRRSGKEVYYRLHERIIGHEAKEPASTGFDGAAIRLPRPAGLQIVDSGFSVQISTATQA